MEISIATTSNARSLSAATTASADNQDTSAASFAAALASTTANTAADQPASTRADADFVSGRIGLNLNHQGIPNQLIYYGENGERLGASAFNAADILRHTQRLNISLEDLSGIGSQLDAAQVGYRPFELYPGTGSDHGIDFDDLIGGGLGTAFDWRYDPLASFKGPGAVDRQRELLALANELGLTANPAVTRRVAPDSDNSSSAGTLTFDDLLHPARNVPTPSTGTGTQPVTEVNPAQPETSTATTTPASSAPTAASPESTAANDAYLNDAVSGLLDHISQTSERVQALIITGNTTTPVMQERLTLLRENLNPLLQRTESVLDELLQNLRQNG